MSGNERSRTVTRGATKRALWTAYNATTFVAHTELGTINIRTGRSNKRLSALLKKHAKATWAFVTAYNPGSTPRSASVNKRAHARLTQAVRRLRVPYWRGEGRGRDRTWPPEPSLLILGITETQARQLGRRFGQLAIVVGGTRQSARLVDCTRARPKKRTTPRDTSSGPVAMFSYCETPDILGGSGEWSLLLDSVSGTRIRTRDSRQMAYDFLVEHVPPSLLNHPRVSGLLEWSGETPVNIAAVVATDERGFRELEAVLHDAGLTNMTFHRNDDRLKFYEDQ